MRGFLNLGQFALGVAFLLLGLCVYLFDRNFVPFLGVPADVYIDVSLDLGVVSGFLPSLLHPLSYSLLCASAVRAGRRNTMIICGAWAGIHGLCELAQAETLYPWLSMVFEAAGRDQGFVRYLDTYCLLGVFDFRDLIAAAAGCVLAWFLIGALDDDRRKRNA